jgi:hypothetical protein
VLSRRSPDLRSERGVMLVLLALLLPLFLIMGSVVVSIGSWYTHGKHLQTKVDASVFAGGGSWNFPCESDVDASIEEYARQYVGQHTKADGLPYSTTTFNPQVGKVEGDQIHAVLNGPDYYDSDTNPTPSEWTDPSGSVCEAKVLDVKGTEQDSPLLWGWLPFSPDIKKKARIEIQQGGDFGGLLPIAVRVPKPVSVAAIWIDETPGATDGDILAAKYFRETCVPPQNQGCLFGMPTGLGHWTTEDTSLPLSNWAEIGNLPATAGVVIATSFRPRCPGPSNCFDLTAFTDIDALCNQGVGRVKCFYTTESGGTQTTQSGLQFIRGYSPANSDPQPDLESVWLDTASGTNCYQGVYFSAPVSNSCFAVLHADVDSGAATAANTEVRYKLIAGDTSAEDDDPPAAGGLDCGDNFQPACELTPSGTARAAPVALDRQYARHSFAIQVRLRNVPLTAVLPLGPLPLQCALPVYGNQCRWFFTGAGRTTNDPTDALIFDNPVQRAFMGDINKSGPVKFLHMYADQTCNGFGAGDYGLTETGEAASIDPNPADPPCFMVEMGLQGALAKDQDEVPIQLNIGASSQSSVLDCDPDIPNLKDEIAQGCGPDRDPIYKANDFDNTPYCPSWNGINNFFQVPKPFPWDDWPPYECVATQTAATPNQVIQGLNERLFGDPNSPPCPVDDAPYKKGRNYWHDLNNEFIYDPPGVEPPQFDYFTFARPSRNHGNLLKKEDPRYVLMFMTPYNSFTGNGNEIYPVVLIGSFYITGYGRILGNGTVINEDPCSDGAGMAVGAGNTPPADLDTSTAGAVAWGHFISRVDLGGGSSTGALCDPAVDFTPCVPVLVE